MLVLRSSINVSMALTAGVTRTTAKVMNVRNSSVVNAHVKINCDHMGDKRMTSSIKRLVR